MHTSHRTATDDRPVILLVQDEPAVRAQLADALQEEGFCVTQAGDLARAADHARRCAPDLIVIEPRRLADTASVVKQLRTSRVTQDIPLVVIQRAGARHGSAGASVSSIDVDEVLEHVWRVVNTRVLGALVPGVAAPVPNQPVTSSDARHNSERIGHGG
jgi:CheY-like chemotaxis protein